MQSSVAFAGKLSAEKGFHPSLNGRAATLLAAVIVGIYLGASTISEIDPFYRNGQARSDDGSYTIDGWRGADAVSPPVFSVPASVPMRDFGLASRYPDYPVQAVTYYSSDPMGDDESADANADDQIADERNCADCSGITPISVDPPTEAVADSAGCASGDPACQDSEDIRGEVASAPPADF